MRALSDYITTFCFGKGVRFKTPKATEAIVPALLQRVWDVDNFKLNVLWEAGQMGGVSGDSWIKVVYEDPWEDSIGMVHPGKVRLLPLNSSHVFPEWHPHDRSRMTRCKLKYRFWATTSEGTRAVHTYVEIITDSMIEEFVNDERVDRRPNPLGRIPIVHVPNSVVAGSPWGLSDIQDLIPLNREFNEKATDLSDIINYNAQPTTVITGAKIANLEKGPGNVWAGFPPEAQVYTLELGNAMGGPMAYLELLKRAMHELVGVPETALGQAQPISNTSGVALAIQFQPLMQKWALKTLLWKRALEQVNELILLTLAIKEPESLRFNPLVESELKPGQYPELLSQDPLTYQTEVEFPPPLPLDVLIKLNEIQGKMSLGLESKRGALRDLGEEFPDEKIAEIVEELIEDTKEQGSLDMLRAQIQQAIMLATGMIPGDGGMEVASPEGGNKGQGGSGGGEPQAGPGRPAAPAPPPHIQQLVAEMMNEAYGVKLAQRRNPENMT